VANTTIADLKPDPRNVRTHNPRNIGMIVNALHQVGAARSIVLDEDNVILAGNGVIEAAAEAGIERVRIIDADGEEIIAVRRSGLTDEQKQKLAIYDNRTAELAAWDTDALADIGEDLDLGEFFTGTELGELGIEHDSVSPYFDALDKEMAEREGMEDVTVGVVVPVMYHDAVVQWLANGEPLTAPGIGRGVLKRCGLL